MPKDMEGHAEGHAAQSRRKDRAEGHAAQRPKDMQRRGPKDMQRRASKWAAGADQSAP